MALSARSRFITMQGDDARISIIAVRLKHWVLRHYLWVALVLLLLALCTGLLVRPHEILKFDREEDPQSMDELMLKAGATPIDWAFKTECCGAGLSVSRTSSVGRLSGKIIRDAKDRGAEAMIVACPMCHSNLDMRRDSINSFLGEKVDIPVLYVTQALGLAVGLDRKALGLHRHFVNVTV